ncbi:MAG TPA: hypothetical protein PLV12_04810 [Saprospiraceae bacterium]|nr:hypothetical protein [Saprospiraceae bacterium]
MKRIFFTALFTGMLLVFTSHAQDVPRYYVNKQPIDSLRVEYITIHARQRFLGSKINVELEYGQVNKSLANSDTRVSDSNGKDIVFNSILDVLNILATLGYEYVDSFIDPKCDDGKTLKFLLRKIK